MNEVYRRDTEDSGRCACSCSKSGTQCVDIREPVILAPAVTVGSVTTVCQGSPVVVCETSDDGTYCTVTLTQKVCVTVPVQYGVTVSKGEASISCSGGSGCSCA